MEALQQFFTGLVSNLADLIPLGYAFGAGMVSTVNPCGFAMLPAYLGLYLGSKHLGPGLHSGAATYGGDSAAAAIPAQVIRAVLVAAVVTGGFVILFGGFGLLFSAGGRPIVKLVPWVALGIGVVLGLMGIAMLLGRHFSASFAARMAARLGDPGTVSIRGFFVFGVAYATASLSCTLPIFLTVVAGSLAVSGFASAALQFVSYALGMGLVVLVLTLGVAAFKGAAVGGLRRALPYVEKVSALLMIVAGSYIVYYWLFKGGLIDSFV